MNDNYLLKEVADIVEDRVGSAMLDNNSYISTETLLPNKSGLKNGDAPPSSFANVPAYKSGDTLISNIRPYLKKIWFADKDGGCSADVLVFRAKKGVDPKFLYYSLFRDDFFTHAMRGSKGTKMPRGDKNQILEFLIPKFDAHQQFEIARALSLLDAKIACNNRIISELESVAKTTYDFWFQQFDFPDINNKPYRSSGGKMIYDNTLKRKIPQNWSAVPLSKFLAKQADSISPENVKKNDIYTPIDSLPIKRMSFGSGNSSSEANSSLIGYKSGDILIGAMRVYFHRVCIAPFDGITRTTTLVLRPIISEFLPYLYQVCNEERAIAVAANISVGTQQPYVNWENSFEDYTIPYPESDELILTYSKKMSFIVKEVIALEKEINELITLRDWLLPILLNKQAKLF